MDAANLILEIDDRHRRHLIYDGPYRLVAHTPTDSEAHLLRNLFEDWRQRIYRFENRLGASVVLYRPLKASTMRWDLMMTRFRSEEPFAFSYEQGLAYNLGWREVQRLLDRIRDRGDIALG